jgi:ADP-ribose pyrophosphatase YjhB (NUDIX family)
MDTPGSAEENILREIKEELGVDAEIEGKAQIFEITDEEGTWVVIAFRVALQSTEITVNPHDHSEIKWVTKSELNQYEQLASFVKNPQFYKLLSF